MKNMKIKKAWVGFYALTLFAVAIIMMGCDSKKEEAKDTKTDPIAKVEENATVDKSDPTLTADEEAGSEVAAPAEDEVADDQEEMAEPSAAKAAEGEARLHPVYMGVWGNVGGTGFNFDMDGTTGSYIPYDFAEGKEYGARRQLKLVSYNPRNGKCVINAFLQGKYIGQFDGTFEEDEVEIDEHNSHTIQAYNGIFTSVKGAKLDFHFHFD